MYTEFYRQLRRGAEVDRVGSSFVRLTVNRHLLKRAASLFAVQMVRRNLR
jgi:hypothetical protein